MRIGILDNGTVICTAAPLSGLDDYNEIKNLKDFKQKYCFSDNIDGNYQLGNDDMYIQCNEKVRRVVKVIDGHGNIIYKNELPASDNRPNTLELDNIEGEKYVS